MNKRVEEIRRALKVEKSTLYGGYDRESKSDDLAYLLSLLDKVGREAKAEAAVWSSLMRWKLSDD
jgi:hypothetical protein